MILKMIRALGLQKYLQKQKRSIFLSSATESVLPVERKIDACRSSYLITVPFTQRSL